jgi:hypothetical protein
MDARADPSLRPALEGHGSQSAPPIDHYREGNDPVGRRVVIVPSGAISAVNAKPPGHSLSLLSDEPLKPTDPENAPAVCARTLADASQ